MADTGPPAATLVSVMQSAYGQNHIRLILRPQGKAITDFKACLFEHTSRQLHILKSTSLLSHLLFFMPSPSSSRSYTSFPSSADLFYYCTTGSTSEEDLNIHYAPPSRSSLRIGVIISGQEQVQLLDLAALDLLAMIGRNRISRMNATAPTIDEAVDEIDIRFVSVTGEGSFPVTAGSRMPVTVS
jgi:hypothetical protein